ncbi:hypothetical protein UFOVP312_14 [uncultured Caudovirales phage]|uniref:Uncharacterized protein n=1 Tax=uncultured Caudovirales phage TaxID=2100421 RepID=A0A6J5LTY8_9CAUD|nr:hypothetical protein UFOVP312_14 [uncultured Caudovirales phage]
MRRLIEIGSAFVISCLIAGIGIALVGLFLKAWYLVFMLGWNAI